MGGRQSSSKVNVAPPARLPLLLRPKVWASLLLLAALALGSHFAWQRFGPDVARHPQFQLSAERITITPQPPWIRSDVKAEVLRDAGLIGSVSVLDNPDALVRRLEDAFEFHPWVAEVCSVRKGLPASLDIELEYRRPVAAVETSDGRGVMLTPIDVNGVRLPEADFTDIERRYLPRISGTTGPPLAGEAWDDSRVIGAARLAAGLADVWQQLRLVQIMPSLQPEIRGDERFYTYVILTSGGTHVVWGAAPSEEPMAGESPFGTKRQRLIGYAAEHGLLDSIDGPARLDVRSDLVVVPRTARRRPTEMNTEPTETK
jgi:hypothetical protein